MQLKLVLVAIILAAPLGAFSQVLPSAERSRLPISAGLGFSEYATDWSGYESGPAVWVDWNFYRAPSFLRGLGLEIEGRDLSFARTGDVPNLREDTAGGGGIYTWRRFRKVHPFGEFLLEYGSIDFSASPTYRHDTRTVRVPGAGAEYQLHRSIWLRGNYEWQFWPHLGHGNLLNPRGITIGIAYDLGAHEASRSRGLEHTF